MYWFLILHNQLVRRTYITTYIDYFLNIISASKLGLFIIFIINSPILNLIPLNTSSLPILRSFRLNLCNKEVVAFNKSPLYYPSPVWKSQILPVGSVVTGRAYYSTESSNSLVNENNILIVASYDKLDLPEEQIFSYNKGSVYR